MSPMVAYLKYDQKFKYKQDWGVTATGLVPTKDFETIYEKWTIIDQKTALKEIESCRYVEPVVPNIKS